MCTGQSIKRFTTYQNNTMAGSYGSQFEALLSEICNEFGRKLIKSWEADSDAPIDKSEVDEFVKEAVANFLGKTTGKPKMVSVNVEKVAPAMSTSASTRPKCTAKTSKGAQCSKFAVGDSGLCSVHGSSASSSGTKAKETKKKAPKIKTKETSEHTHEPGTDDNCECCEKHGGPFEIPEFEEVVASTSTVALSEEDFDDE